MQTDGPRAENPPPLPRPAAGVTIGLVNTHYVILPIPVVIQAPRRVRPGSFFKMLRCQFLMRRQSKPTLWALTAAPAPFRLPPNLQVDPRGKQWNRLRASIGQPNFV